MAATSQGPVKEGEAMDKHASLFHVGCGPKRKNQTVKAFASPEWEEVTLDIDKSVKPDLVDKLPELSQVESNSFDAVYTAHNIEHL